VSPKYNYATEEGKSVTVSSIKIWNNHIKIKDIKTKSSVNSFKFALKNYLESYIRVSIALNYYCDQ
jgi:hypothetical protein